MKKILLFTTIGILAGTVANADSKTSLSYVSSSTDLTSGNATAALDMDGFALGTSIDITEQIIHRYMKSHFIKQYPSITIITHTY